VVLLRAKFSTTHLLMWLNFLPVPLVFGCGFCTPGSGVPDVGKGLHHPIGLTGDAAASESVVQTQFDELAIDAPGPGLPGDVVSGVVV
jgi:hypothetical protein